MDAVHCTTESPPIPCFAHFRGYCSVAGVRIPDQFSQLYSLPWHCSLTASNKPHPLEYAAGQDPSEQPDEEMRVQLPYWFMVGMLSLFSQDSCVRERAKAAFYTCHPNQWAQHSHRQRIQNGFLLWLHTWQCSRDHWQSWEWDTHSKCCQNDLQSLCLGLLVAPRITPYITPQIKLKSNRLIFHKRFLCIPLIYSIS